jgi:hypothetical protein
MRKRHKRIRAAMMELAREIGAMRGGRPDWYLVAEHLAEIARPDLLESPPKSNRPTGRPKADGFAIVLDVSAVRREKGCGVVEACKLLAQGELPHRVTAHRLDGTAVKLRVASRQWKNQDPDTLRVSYYKYLREWGK